MSSDKQKLGAYATLQGGYAFSSNDSQKEEGVRWLKIANVTTGNTSWDTTSYLPDSFISSYADYILKESDIVMAMTRPILNLKLKVAKLTHSDCPCLLNQRVGRILSTKKADSLFIYHYIQGQPFVFAMTRAISGSDPPNISSKIFENIKVNFPRLSEQKKIAEILSTWDESIEKTEKLIELKKKLKKGLMQQLLSGKKRFKEFGKEKWKVIQLGNIGTFKTSSVDKKTKRDESPIRLVNYMNVYKNNFIKNDMPLMKVTANATQIKTNNLLKGDILFTPSSETPDDIGHSAVVTENMPNTLHSYHLVRYRLKNNQILDFDFRGYVFNKKQILNEFSRRATGITRFTLSLKDFNEICTEIPTSITEQKKIASVLSVADEEIDLLIKKVVALKAQKKGLMQKLLMGKIRVKNL